MKIKLFIFLALITCKLTAQDNTYRPYQSFQSKDLLEDFNLIVSSLKEGHAGLYNFTDSSKLNIYITKVRKLLERPMDERTFYGVVSEFLSKIQCGHTFVLPSKNYMEFSKKYAHVLPFNCYVQNDSLFLKQVLCGDTSLKSGLHVKKINGNYDYEIIHRLRKIIHADGSGMGRREMLLGNNFQFYYRMIYGYPLNVHLKIGQKNEYKQVVVPTEKLDTLKKYYHLRYIQDSISNVSYKYIDSLSTGVLAIKALKGNKEEFDQKLKSTFKQINQEGIQHLVLDLRNNFGGETEKMILAARYLLPEKFKVFRSITTASKGDQKYSFLTYTPKLYRYLTKKVHLTKHGKYEWRNKKYLKYYKPKKHHYTGKLYVLINEGTFSGASHLAASLYNRDSTVFIGNETGGNSSLSNAGISATLLLKHTKLLVNIPLLKGTYYVNNIKNTSRGIIPNIQATPSIEDKVNNVDSVLQKLLLFLFKNEE